VISGSGVDGGAAASCDIALLAIPHSTSQLAPAVLRTRLAIDVIVPILKSLGRIRHRQRIRKSACRRYATDESISIDPAGIGHAWRSLKR
jgi:predicted dinucleotide-binding enzyme